VGAGWIPNDCETPVAPFPKLHFSAGVDPLTPDDLATYSANAGPGGWGAALQVPFAVGAVAIAYRPAQGTWNEAGKKIAGNSYSRLKLTVDQWCGIYTGAIVDWRHPLFAPLVGMRSAPVPITVFWRAGGGTTYLFVAALLAQCEASSSPVPASWR